MNTEITTHAAEPLFLAGEVSPALQIMLNDRLFERTKLIAKYMAQAEGFTPRHLIGKTEACFAVVVRALTWKLDPFAVASCTYQTPGGNIGYEGKLIIAVLESSGKLEGGLKFDHYGVWANVQGKFAKKTSDKGKEYAVPTWTDADANGLGVMVTAKLKGEAEPRKLEFDLLQAFPRNSTLWATDPKTQICYTAARRFGNVACPAILMGVPFDREDWEEPMRDVSPPERPRLADFLHHQPVVTPYDEDNVVDDEAEQRRVAAIIAQHKTQLGEDLDEDEEPPAPLPPAGDAPAGDGGVSLSSEPAGADIPPLWNARGGLITENALPWLDAVADGVKALGNDLDAIKAYFGPLAGECLRLSTAKLRDGALTITVNGAALAIIDHVEKVREHKRQEQLRFAG